MSARLTAKETIRTAPFARRPSRVTSSRARSAPTRAMAKEIISTDTSAAAAGPYNQAVKVGNTVYVSGQIGLTPAMEFAGDSIEEQTEQVMKNIGEVLAAAGATYEDVVKTTIMLADMSDFKTVNAIYGKRFPENSPARYHVRATHRQRDHSHRPVRASPLARDLLSRALRTDARHGQGNHQHRHIRRRRGSV